MSAFNQAVIEYLLASTDCDSETDILTECIYSDDRLVYRVKCNGRRYIFKTMGTSRKSSDEFSIEFNIMHKIWKSTGGSVLMPEPLLLLDDGFLMTECDGEPLKDKYYQSLLKFFKRKNIYKSFVLSAVWLEKFHSTSLSKESYKDAFSNRKQHLARMTESIDLADKYNGSNSMMTQISLYFNKKNAIDEIEMSVLHGNFALRNIMYDNNKISLIDFEDSKFDTIYYDLGMFIAEIMNKSILGFNKKYNDTLIDNFISEYAKSFDVDNDLLNTYILYHLVCSYYEVVNRSEPSSIIKKLIYKYKRKFTFNLLKSFFESVSK